MELTEAPGWKFSNDRATFYYLLLTVKQFWEKKTYIPANGPESAYIWEVFQI